MVQTQEVLEAGSRMVTRDDIRNVAIIAHVDHGKKYRDYLSRREDQYH